MPVLGSLFDQNYFGSYVAADPFSLIGPGFWELTLAVLVVFALLVYFYTYKGGHMFAGRFANTPLHTRVIQILLAVVFGSLLSSLFLFHAGTWALTYSSLAKEVRIEGIVTGKYRGRRRGTSSTLMTSHDGEVTLVTRGIFSQFEEGSFLRIRCMEVKVQECRIVEIGVNP